MPTWNHRCGKVKWIQWYVQKVRMVLPNLQIPKILPQNVANLLHDQTIQNLIKYIFSFEMAFTARSRIIAKSGSNPVHQNTNDTDK